MGKFTLVRGTTALVRGTTALVRGATVKIRVRTGQGISPGERFWDALLPLSGTVAFLRAPVMPSQLCNTLPRASLNVPTGGDGGMDAAISRPSSGMDAGCGPAPQADSTRT
jgi:hypothetical protein